MTPFFKVMTAILGIATSFSAMALSSQELRHALQEKEFSSGRGMVLEALQTAQPTNKMPHRWHGTRGTVFESAPIGGYRLYAALPRGVLPETATLRTLLSSEVKSKVQRSKTGNLLATYALPDGKGTVRFAMIRRDQTHLMADKNPKAADKRFLMTAVPEAKRAKTAYALHISEGLRKSILQAINTHDMPALMRRLARTQLDGYKALIPHIEGYQLSPLNAGLQKLGLPPLRPTLADAPKYRIRGRDGQTYTLRPFKSSDESRVHGLQRAHMDQIVQGIRFISFSPASGFYKSQYYIERYKNYFLPRSIEKFWVLQGEQSGRIFGWFDYSVAGLSVVIHPECRGQGLAQLMHQKLMPYFQAHLGTTQLQTYWRPGHESLSWPPMPEVINFKTVTQRMVERATLMSFSYAGFEAKVAYTNVPSLKVFSQGTSIAKFEDGFAYFAFPPTPEDATKRQLVNQMLSTTTEEERMALLPTFIAHQASPENAIIQKI